MGRTKAADGPAPLVMTGVAGTALTAGERALVSRGVGGVLLFSRNFESPAQLAGLADSVRRLAPDPGSPPLVAVDHEGGRVQRFRSPFTEFPPMGEVGRLGDPVLVRSLARAQARELAAAGVTLDLAPVCDLRRGPPDGVVGDRAFGEDPEAVAALAAAAVGGYLAGGVLPCAKHFPGHGAALADSHLGPSVLDLGLEDLRSRELVPFRAAVRAGAPLVMTGHLSVPALDPSLPASLSPAAHALLRRELGPGVLVVTDDMQMGAVAARLPGRGEAALAAVEAGADLVEYRDPGPAEEALEAIGRGLAGSVLRERAGRSARLRARALAGLPPPPPPGAVGDPAHRRLLDGLLARLGG